MISYTNCFIENEIDKTELAKLTIALKLKEDDLYVFNFITSKGGRWGSISGRCYVEGRFGMKWVPVLDENYILPDDLEEFKIYADGKSVVNPKVLRKGLVLRNKDATISFKNISREYLLKKKE